MNQFDSMLPPGEIWRKTLDKSLMGLEMCWFGGGDTSARDDAQNAEFWSHHYNKQLYAHQNEVGEGNVEFAKDTVAIQRANQEKNLSFQDRGRHDDWSRNNKIIGMQNEAAQQAYDKSEGIFKKQIGYNRDAAIDAIKGSNNRRYERELELELNKRKTNLEAEGSKLKLDAFRKEAAFKAQSNFLEGIENIGAVAINTGRSAVQEKIRAASKVAGIAAALSEQVNSAGSQFNLEALGFDIDRIGHHETGLSIKRKHSGERDQILLQLKQADLQADARRLAKPMMMPPITKPELLPRQEFQDPQPWKPGPAPIRGAVYQGGGSGGGGGGGGVGAVLGAVGGVATAASAAGVGLGAMGVTVGAAALGPIGVAIGGVALAGEAFGWWD